MGNRAVITTAERKIGLYLHWNGGCMDPGDNGIYSIEGWRIADRVLPYEGFVEQSSHDFDDMLRAFDEAMPEDGRLGDLLDGAEIPASDLEIEDEVWISDFDGRWEHYPVVARSEKGTPLVARYDHDRDWGWNPNNRIESDTALIVPRE